MGTSESRNRGSAVTVDKKEKAVILWTHTTKEGKLYGERTNSRHNLRSAEKRKTKITDVKITDVKITDTWEDNIKKWTRLDNDDLLQSVEDRRNWRMIVHKAANPRTENG